jgi:hypothetical protein
MAPHSGKSLSLIGIQISWSHIPARPRNLSPKHFTVIVMDYVTPTSIKAIKHANIKNIQEIDATSQQYPKQHQSYTPSGH